MKASKLIKELQKLIEENGDCEVVAFSQDSEDVTSITSVCKYTYPEVRYDDRYSYKIAFYIETED